MPENDEDLFQYALSADPSLKTEKREDVIAYVRETLNAESNKTYAPEQMQEQVQPEKLPYGEVIKRGFMQEPLPPNSGIGRNIVHGAYGELLPTIGAVAGAPAGPAGIMAGAAAGRASQKAIASGIRAIEGQPATETPLQVASDVALTGAMQGIGQKTIGSTKDIPEMTTGGIIARLRPNAPVWPIGPKSGAQSRQLIRGSLSETPELVTPASAKSGVVDYLANKGKGTRQIAINEVNALIKPKTINYVYGRNPGKQIIDEKITGSTFEEIHSQLEQRLDEVGKLYEPILSSPVNRVKRLNVDNFTQPLDNAIAAAKRNPRTNAPLLTRLENARRDLRMEMDDLVSGGSFPGAGSFKRMSPAKAVELKRTIGEITKFTADKNDDNIVNAALKQSYNIVDRKLDLAVPELKGLNERWANLLGATVAARNKALMDMNRRQWVAPVAEVVAGAGMGAMSGHPFTGIAAGVAGAGLHRALTSPGVITKTAQGLTNVVAPAFEGAARGLESAAQTQIPQTGVRKVLLSDPLGLFEDYQNGQ